MVRHVVFAVLCASLAAGCGGEPGVAPVSGLVTVGGQVPGSGSGRITFYPEQGRAATAPISKDGTYTLSTFGNGDGALVGKHRVAIKYTRIVGSAPRSYDEEMKGGATQQVMVFVVPERYGDPQTSELTAEVEKKENRRDFNLP